MMARPARRALLLGALAGGASAYPRPAPDTPFQSVIDPLEDIVMTPRWTWGAGTTFDLSSMTLASPMVYKVADVRNSNTVYYFNIGANVNPPQAGPPPTRSRCTDGRAPGYPGSGCWQIENANDLSGDTQQCYSLSGPASAGWNMSLYDPTKPARGVSLTMLGGDGQWCPAQQQRTFTVSLLCAPVAPQAVYTGANVFELNTCDYRMELKSSAGCPQECTGGGASICGGNGVCGYDTDSQRSKCFCYTGFSGAGCAPNSAAAQGLSAEGVILIVVCIVLLAVIALVAFMFMKLRKLQVDPAAYDQLQGRFNELGMLA